VRLRNGWKKKMIDETNNIDERRLIIPGLAGGYGVVAPLGYATIRVLVALVLLPGGIDKVFYGGAARIATGNITSLGLPLPYAWAWAVACIEFFGSIMLALGLFTRPLAVAMTTMLAVIAFGIMVKRGMFWTTGGLEVALLLGLVTLAFVIGGGGRYSLDRVIGREF
jgi:putative oxidoreductase